MIRTRGTVAGAAAYQAAAFGHSAISGETPGKRVSADGSPSIRITRRRHGVGDGLDVVRRIVTVGEVLERRRSGVRERIQAIVQVVAACLDDAVAERQFRNRMLEVLVAYAQAFWHR